MSQLSFSPEWLKQFSDPYAVMGLSLAADDQRVLKRYRVVAKLLHPDRYVIDDLAKKELTSQILARLVNPAYQRLKQAKGRAETMALLRFRVRRATRDESLKPQSQLALQLLQTSTLDTDVFYEQAITSLSESQYQRLDQFEAITQELGELNSVYLRLKMGEPLIREKRSGIISVSDAQPIQFTPIPTTPSPSTISYAQRHYRRAQEYMKRENWSMAIQELRDAIKIEANKSDYHALLAKAYLMQNFQGMAKVHFRQALKLNPKDPIALKYTQKFNIALDQVENVKNTKNSIGSLFKLFAKKR